MVFERSSMTIYGEGYSLDVTLHDGMYNPFIGHSIAPSFRSLITYNPLSSGWQHGMHAGPPRTGNDSSSNIGNDHNFEWCHDVSESSVGYSL